MCNGRYNIIVVHKIFFFFEVITTTQNAQYDDMAILPRGLANIRIIESKVNCVFIIK